jgi:hypothetical protein
MREKADLQMDATVASAYRAMANSYGTKAAHRELEMQAQSEAPIHANVAAAPVRGG